MVVFHLRASTGGFRCPLPEGIGSPGAGLSQTKPVGKSSQSRFKAVSTRGCLFGAADVMRASMGDAGGFLRHSSGGSGASSHPSGAGVGGCGGRDHCLPWDQETGVGRGYPGWSCCRSPVQNPGSESRRSPGQRLGGERSPGSPTIRVVHRFSLLSFQPGRASVLSPSSLVALVLRAGFLKKKFLFFPKRLLGYLDHLFFGFCSNNSYLKSDHF